MENRTQYVVCNGHTSHKSGVRCGVPQGSLLGVLLFQVHINDLKSSLKFSDAILYADDTTVFLIGRNLRALKAKVQSDLNALSRWLSTNMLKLNVMKTKSILFCRTDSPTVSLYVAGEAIQSVKCFIFLGFFLDQNLTFEHHAYHLYESLLHSIFLMRKSSTFIPQTCLRSLYYAYYFGRLNYGVNIWYPLLKQSERTKLYTLQKRIIRIVSKKAPLVHCMPLFKRINILTLPDMVLLENVKLMYRIDRTLIAYPIVNLFKKTSTFV